MAARATMEPKVAPTITPDGTEKANNTNNKTLTHLTCLSDIECNFWSDRR